jgi:hypothetical protein
VLSRSPSSLTSSPSSRTPTSAPSTLSVSPSSQRTSSSPAVSEASVTKRPCAWVFGRITTFCFDTRDIMVRG